MVEVIADSLIAEGMARGIERGRVEGRAEGEILASKAALRALLEERFGTLPEVLIDRIEAATDLPRLQMAIRQVLRLEKLDDLQL